MSASAPSGPAPPPSYEQATGSSSRPNRIDAQSRGGPSIRNGIPPEHRRSMEDEHRPLPPGWARQFDAQEQHQFFVDTRANPPRSIWHHPLDDEQYLSTLEPDERQRITHEKRTMSHHDFEAESSDDEHQGTELPPRPAAGASSAKSGDNRSFGRKMKDKLTGTTHQERETARQRREEEERRAYQAHLQARQAMVRAMETGQPQFLCKDRQGRDIYIEPPTGPYAPRGAYGYNPYSTGPYANPNTRFVRPAEPYGRPYGAGYGGGFGAPIAAGFLGGALLGGLMF